MKKLFILAFLSIAPASCSVAQAQTFTSGSEASSSAGAVSQSGAQAISGGGSGGVGASNFTIIPQSTVSINSTGSKLSEAVPLVTAPQMTILGGEDSCLKSKSGGVGVSGFGGSFGTMVMDNECNRRVLSKLATIRGNNAMANAILCGSPQWWAADYRIAKWQGTTPTCHNDQPSSANEVDINLASEETKWSYAPRKATSDDDLFD